MRSPLLSAESAQPGARLVTAPQLRLASYNIHKCVGRDGRFDPGRTLGVLLELDADIVALQEVDRRFGDRAGLLDLAALEQLTGLVPVPVSHLPKSHGWHGNLLLSRVGDVRNIQTIALPGLEPRGAIVADVALPGHGPLRIIATHLGLLRRSRAEQVRVIADAVAAGDPPRTLLMGDLNEWRLDHPLVLQDLSLAFGELPAGVASFPARRPLLALDRIIASPRLPLSPVCVHDTPLARLASDHLPITATAQLI